MARSEHPRIPCDNVVAASLTRRWQLKTVDTNSAYFAKFCFSLGMQLKRIEVIADDEDEIIEAARRMSKNYDFVVTSGGIGPTYVYAMAPDLLQGSTDRGL